MKRNVTASISPFNNEVPLFKPSIRPSSEFVINSDNELNDVIIIKKDFKKSMIQPNRNRSSNQNFNKKVYLNEIRIRIKNPDTVFNKQFEGNDFGETPNYL